MVHPDSPSHTPAWGLALLRRTNLCRQGLTYPGVMAGIQTGGSGTQGEEGLELSHGRPPSSQQGLPGLRGALGGSAAKQHSGPPLPRRCHPHSTRARRSGCQGRLREREQALLHPTARAKPPEPERGPHRVRGASHGQPQPVSTEREILDWVPTSIHTHAQMASDKAQKRQLNGGGAAFWTNVC